MYSSNDLPTFRIIMYSTMSIFPIPIPCSVALLALLEKKMAIERKLSQNSKLIRDYKNRIIANDNLWHERLFKS